MKFRYLSGFRTCFERLGVWLLMVVVLASNAQGLTIDEAVRLALKGNVEFQARRQTIAVVEGEHRSARTFRHNPHLEVEAAAGSERNDEREDASSFAVELSQEFELGGQQRLRTQIALAELEQTRWDVNEAQRELIKEVKETFYRILFLQEKLDFASQTVELAQQLLGVTEERFRAGDSPQLDVNLAGVELQNTRRQRGDVHRQLAQARFTLNRLLGRPLDAPLPLRGTLDVRSQPIDAVELRRLAVQQRPDLQSRRAAITAAAEEVALAKAERIPDIEIGFIFEREAEGDKVTKLFGGKVAVPLPLWNRNRGEIHAARARVRMAELEHAARQAAIENEVASAVAEVDQLRAAVQMFTDTIVPQSRENLTLFRQAFAAGEVDIADLIAEQRAFIATGNEYLESRFDYRVALASLETIVGKALMHQP